MHIILRLAVLVAMPWLMAMPRAWAQDARPLRIVVITAPGGSADFLARMVAERLSPKLGRPVIVDNKPGAGGNIASAFVAKSPPDASTVLLTSNNHTINPQIFQNAGYDALKDFMPVIQMTRGPIVLAGESANPATNLAEYLALARKDPRMGNFGTYGIGGAAHLVGEMLREASAAGLHHIPYRGAGPAIAEAIGGQIPSVIVSLASASPQIKAGKLRALAIASAARWPGHPDIPTMAESGYKDLVYDVWIGLLAPAGTSPAFVATLNREIASILTTREARDLLEKQGMEPVAGSPAEFAKNVGEEFVRMGGIIRKSHITAE